MASQELYNQAIDLWKQAKTLNVAAGASLDPKKTIEGMQSAIGKKFDYYFDALVLFRQAIEASHAEGQGDGAGATSAHLQYHADKVHAIADALTEVAPAELLIDGWEIIPFAGCHTFIKGKLKAYYEREHELFAGKYNCPDYATYIHWAFAEVAKVVNELIADADIAIAGLPEQAAQIEGWKKMLVAKKEKVARWEKHMG